MTPRRIAIVLALGAGLAYVALRPVCVPLPPDAVNTTVAPPAVMLLPAASFACSVRLTALPDATLKVLDCGHLMMREKPTEVLDELIAFLGPPP